MPIQNLLVSQLAALRTLAKKVAARYGDTPSGYSGDIIQATKEILNGEHTPFRESIPSQRTYIYEEENFPVSQETALIDSTLPQYNVNFGLDTLYLPISDSLTVESYIGKPRSKEQFGPGPYFNQIVETTTDKPNFYDAGRHTVIADKTPDGKHIMHFSDVYNFDQANKYLERYKSNTSNKTPLFLRKLAVKAMEAVGQPYEVHQTVPIKYVDWDESDVWNGKGELREMFENVAKLHGVEFKIPLENVADGELENYNINSGSGDDLVKHWQKLGLLKNSGGKLNK